MNPNQTIDKPTDELLHPDAMMEADKQLRPVIAHCDRCKEPIHRGEDYTVGLYPWNKICESCFEQYDRGCWILHNQTSNPMQRFIIHVELTKHFIITWWNDGVMEVDCYVWRIAESTVSSWMEEVCKGTEEFHGTDEHWSQEKKQKAMPEVGTWDAEMAA